jgi:hypothetical protein
MYGVFENSRNHSPNDQQFKTHWTDTITSTQNLAPWPTTAFDIAQILFATFYFMF